MKLPFLSAIAHKMRMRHRKQQIYNESLN